jgi:hypothetical protein
MKTYYLFKVNGANFHEIDEHTKEDVAVKMAVALHDPDWPVWQYIDVIEIDNANNKKNVFSTRQKNLQ